MIRLLIALASLGALGYGGWQAWDSFPIVREFVQKHTGFGQFYTLEAHFSSQQIMEESQNSLIKTTEHSYLSPSLEFHPYLLMEVKFTHENKTNEGIILWSQRDGEMVVDTRTWEKTHGFEDCINSKATKTDFKILNALSKHKGIASKSQLMNTLYVENDVLEHWLQSCLNKHLIVKTDNKYRLHFESPRLNVAPETRMYQRLVTKQYQGAERMPSQYSESDIRRIAQAAFGNDFAVRKITEVFLPVYNIKVKNPDGSIHTSHWNALNGKSVEIDFHR